MALAAYLVGTCPSAPPPPRGAPPGLWLLEEPLQEMALCLVRRDPPLPRRPGPAARRQAAHLDLCPQSSSPARATLHHPGR